MRALYTVALHELKSVLVFKVPQFGSKAFSLVVVQHACQLTK